MFCGHPKTRGSRLSLPTQDNWNDVVNVGAHIKFSSTGPWATKGAPVITRPIALVGMCRAINAAGGTCYIDANGVTDKILTYSGVWACDSAMARAPAVAARLQWHPGQLMAVSSSSAPLGPLPSPRRQLQDVSPDNKVHRRDRRCRGRGDD